MLRLSYFCLIVVFTSRPVFSQAPPTPMPPQSAPEPGVYEARSLSKAMYSLLLTNMPTPIIEKKIGWDDQKESVIGIKWEREGPIRFKPVPMKAMRNDGHWQKMRAEAIDPAKTLALHVTDLKYPEEGKTTFTANISLDTRLIYEQQLWTAGRRVYGGETRCRCHADLKLAMELTNKIAAKPDSLIPVLSIRARVVSANLTYRDLVFEHTLGIDGKPAEVVGKVAMEFVKKIKPDLEADLLAKANAAIVKAADTKEVRVEFDQLLQGKPPMIIKDKK